MAGDIANKKFLEEEVKPVVRKTIPALQKAVEKLQARVTALENPIGAKKDVEKAEPKPKKAK